MSKISITVIIGLPGSGKTTLALKMVDDKTFLIDDFSLNKELVNDFLKTGLKNLVLTDPRLCITTKKRAETVLKTYLGDNIFISWIAFENDVESCWKNVQERKDGRIIGRHFLDSLSEKYTPFEFTDNPNPVFKK